MVISPIFLQVSSYYKSNGYFSSFLSLCLLKPSVLHPLLKIDETGASRKRKLSKFTPLGTRTSLLLTFVSCLTWLLASTQRTPVSCPLRLLLFERVYLAVMAPHYTHTHTHTHFHKACTWRYFHNVNFRCWIWSPSCTFVLYFTLIFEWKVILLSQSCIYSVNLWHNIRWGWGIKGKATANTPNLSHIHSSMLASMP